MDRSIVEAARGGDHAAFDALVRTEVDRVYRLALAITGNESDAADAVQETFVAAWRKLRDLRDADAFDAWLTRLTINASRMSLRTRRRRFVREIPVADVDPGARRPAPTGEGAGSLSTSSSSPDAREDGMDLRAALARLPAEQRSLLALRHLEGRGIAEIAGVLGIPEGTAKSRLFAARRALERALDEGARHG
ncbi:MAG TPA: sigma-70 family RNA polymerase sigma factor [Candidatus Limnocylindrales bacterium]|nr:sigma-70 family RNA polymerase sigma factor [Candidatus Limnocylindrales bacterium]